MWNRLLRRSPQHCCFNIPRQRRWLVSATIPMQSQTKSDDVLTEELKVFRLTNNGDLEPDVKPRDPRIWLFDTVYARDEMNVKIVKVTPTYALCRPLDFPHIKGKISRNELTRFVAYLDCRELLKEHMIVRASVVAFLPPDRVIFSIRRVRPKLLEAFQPFTIVIFNVPCKVSEKHLKAEMELQGGRVVEVVLGKPAITDRTIRVRSSVTFIRKRDALKAIKKWNVTKFPVYMGKKEIKFFKLKVVKSSWQNFKERLQKHIDEEFEEVYDTWTETAEERARRRMTEKELWDMLPLYMTDRLDEAERLPGYVPLLATNAEMAQEALQQQQQQQGKPASDAAAAAAAAAAEDDSDKKESSENDSDALADSNSDHDDADGHFDSVGTNDEDALADSKSGNDDADDSFGTTRSNEEDTLADSESGNDDADGHFDSFGADDEDTSADSNSRNDDANSHFDNYGRDKDDQ